jgi:hypothetical protein
MPYNKTKYYKDAKRAKMNPKYIKSRSKNSSSKKAKFDNWCKKMSGPIITYNLNDLKEGAN